MSFEPISTLFEQIKTITEYDSDWLVENIALGNVNTENYINISGGHSGASSLLEMTENVIRNAPDQTVVGRERIQEKTLASIIHQYYPDGNNLFLEIDVQGYEEKVLEGAKSSLSRVIGIKIKMSLRKNYEGETLWIEMYQYLYSLVID